MTELFISSLTITFNLFENVRHVMQCVLSLTVPCFFSQAKRHVESYVVINNVHA